MFLRIFLCCCCLLLKMFVSQRKFLQIYFASTSPTRKQASNTRAEHSRELDLLREMERKRSSSFHKQKRSFHVIPFKFSPLPNKSETLLCPKGSAITPPPWKMAERLTADGRWQTMPNRTPSSAEPDCFISLDRFRGMTTNAKPEPAVLLS